MFEALLILLAIFAVSFLFIWLARRSLRIHSVFLRWLSVVLAGFIGLVVGIVGVVGLIGMIRVHAPRASAPVEFTASTDPHVIARGEHFADILCADCHSAAKVLPLSGAPDLLKGADLPIGYAAPYNLTPGGPLKEWSDGEIFRAIRHNIDKDGRKLPIMNSTGIGTLGDEDIKALVAYLRSQPSIQNDVGEEKFTLIGYLLIGGGMIPQFERPVSIESPTASPDAEYGEYMVSYLSCRDCHGPDLTGGQNDLFPLGPNLVESVSGWTAEEFTNTLRTGKTPSGRQLSNVLMPYETYGKADDMEIQAIYEYLSSLSQPITSK